MQAYKTYNTYIHNIRAGMPVEVNISCIRIIVSVYSKSEGIETNTYNTGTTNKRKKKMLFTRRGKSDYCVVAIDKGDTAIRCHCYYDYYYIYVLI